jgi:glucose-6-phosphate dehydrogenase assembly protein OpcA
MGLMTLVCLVAEPGLLDRADNGVAAVVRAHPSRTIVASWRSDGPAAITAEVTLHHTKDDAPACGDAIHLEAIGAGRQWLPENIVRLTLPDLPVCVWWLGDLPDGDRLFEQAVAFADMVVVNSGEMDLRDLEKLSEICARSRDRYAVTDLTWFRLRPLQELVARFFDDELGRGQLSQLERAVIEFAPRLGETDVASTQAGLLFGWIAQALDLRTESISWRRAESWGEVALGRFVARFERRSRDDVPAGSILRVALECRRGRFEIERQEDPCVFRWSRDLPDSAAPPHTLRIAIQGETALLVRCLENPKRDRLLEASLHMGSRIVRPVAPRVSVAPQ